MDKECEKSEFFNKMLEKKKQTGMKSTITEMKNNSLRYRGIEEKKEEEEEQSNNRNRN